MREFIKDYKEVLKISGKFCKKHWIGILVIMIVTALCEVTAVVMSFEDLREYWTGKLKSVFKRK